MNRSTLVRLLVSVLLIILLLYVLGRSAYGQAAYIMEITGNSDAVTFHTSNYVTTTPMQVIWGVDSQAPVTQTFTTQNQTAVLIPPSGTVSLFFNQPGVTVQTPFTLLHPDGWYAVPLGNQAITISRSASTVDFTANFTPTVPLEIIWGVSSQPAVTTTLTFTNNIASLIPPVDTVSVFANWTRFNIGVVTDFTPLTADGWYAVPPGLIVIPKDYEVFVPLLQ